MRIISKLLGEIILYIINYVELFKIIYYSP